MQKNRKASKSPPRTLVHKETGTVIVIGKRLKVGKTRVDEDTRLIVHGCTHETSNKFSGVEDQKNYKNKA